MKVARSWETPSARVALCKADRGDEMVRETCPSTQIWLLLSGQWREAGNGQKLRVQKFEAHRYAPRQPSRRAVEEDSRALSIELFRVGGTPTLTPKQLRAIWRITHLALTSGFEPLELEEHLACFAEETTSLPAPSDWLSHATEIIHAEFREPLTLSGLADRVGISPNHLSSAFKAVHGVPISKLIRRLRLQDALRRMETDKAPWLAAGFYDASHFWHACKSDLDLTPGQVADINRKFLQDKLSPEIR